MAWLFLLSFHIFFKSFIYFWRCYMKFQFKSQMIHYDWIRLDRKKPSPLLSKVNHYKGFAIYLNLFKFLFFSSDHNERFGMFTLKDLRHELSNAKLTMSYDDILNTLNKLRKRNVILTDSE